MSHQLTCFTRASYRRIGVHYGARCEDRSFGGSEDLEIETFFDRGLNETESTSVQRKCCLCNALETLNEVIFASISHWITGDEVIIVPDGQSFLIPYAALVDQRSKYLSERLRIRLALSLTTLRLLTECPEEHHVQQVWCFACWEPVGENCTYQRLQTVSAASRCRERSEHDWKDTKY